MLSQGSRERAHEESSAFRNFDGAFETEQHLCLSRKEVDPKVEDGDRSRLDHGPVGFGRRRQER